MQKKWKDGIEKYQHLISDLSTQELQKKKKKEKASHLVLFLILT